MSDRPMSIREYKEYAKKQHGSKSVNESMLKHMDRVTDGKKISKTDWDQINAKIKIAQVNEKLHG